MRFPARYGWKNKFQHYASKQFRLFATYFGCVPHPKPLWKTSKEDGLQSREHLEALLATKFRLWEGARSIPVDERCQDVYKAALDADQGSGDIFALPIYITDPVAKAARQQQQAFSRLYGP